MRFSILHPSARPGEWRKVYDAWMAAAVHPEHVQYILSIDPRWNFATDPAAYEDLPANITVTINQGRRCYVDAVNGSAQAADGDVLVAIADDQYPCEEWDEVLETLCFGHSGEFVVCVSTGTPREHEREICVLPILSRARYDRLGYVFYPAYESMYADNDFLAHAEHDQVIIDGRFFIFPHKHWMTGDRKPDKADEQQNRKEAYDLGAVLFERRRAAGFGAVNVRRKIAVCFAGERFEGVWVDAMLTLYGHLVDLDFEILRVRPECWSNVFISREAMRRAVMSHTPNADLSLWIDDDNLLSPSQFDRLLEVLDGRPEVDGVAGWCWISNKEKTGFMPSCGLWAPDHLHWNPFPGPEFVHAGTPREFETGGLPCILLRHSALEKAGEGAFLPVLDNRLEYGMSGEDTAFFLAAERGGAKFLVDPTVRIPHLKYVSVDPVFPEEGKVPVRVACMIRARNEGRWIRRVIEAAKPLCGDSVYVLEDGSTDNTVEECEAAGAHVVHSPFAGLGVDERRDKDYLLEHVRKECNPDWIFMPDGDEELEPGGCDKLRRVLETNPPVDCFALKFLYLWDALDTVRVDGSYSAGARQSLFRANSGLKFKGYYEAEGQTIHAGLHTSNAPGLGGMRVRVLNVFLIHYGYLLREDRIRKFRWITSVDPDNEREDFYRHTVQGDGEIIDGAGRLVNVGADEKLKHGGPLKLVTMPARLVPQMAMPEPFRKEENDGNNSGSEIASRVSGRSVGCAVRV